MHYVVIENYPSLDCLDISKWMNRNHARLIAEVNYQDHARSRSLAHVYLMHLEDE